ncbi:elongation factor 4 [Candidatus Falkowbacteria bacterium]|nr:elongation factor 4 [Candidatus Falkowbacteria bacterium]
MDIRNFCIIAHIDHGKSTLADRFLELTGTVEKRKMKEQVLDMMDLERERGITIKLQPVRMIYRQILNSKSETLNKSQNTNSKSLEFRNSDLEFAGSEYILNLIDTPGHVDFNYEVSRSLAAVEGAILLVDAAQGVQAQTLANLYLAVEQGLTIIPVINKIDLPAANVEKVKKEILSIIGCSADEILLCSAKTGEGVAQILDAVISRVPAPVETRFIASLRDKPLRALIFDSFYDEYRGVVAYVRVKDGEVKKGDKIFLIGTRASSEVLDCGIMKPELNSTDGLAAGEIGYITTGLKIIEDCRVGDTITNVESKGKIEALAGYKQVKPMVYAGVFCRDGSEFNELREAIGKLKLNDAALIYEPENSPVLGFGFRCGFLGLLHLEIFQERLRREFGLDLVVTVPSVAYKVVLKGGKFPTHVRQEQIVSENEYLIKNPNEFPDPSQIERMEEPIMSVDIVSPKEYLGHIMTLVQESRGEYLNTEFLDETRVILHYRMPLAMLIVDFYDKLKSATSGYGSMNYEIFKYKTAELVKMDIFVGDEIVEALSTIVYKDSAFNVGKKIVQSLKDTIPRHQFVVKLQAGVGGKIIAAERISALRKDVTEKLYGGDWTRRQKLLEKQKKGKKKMMAFGKGRVNIPPEAFLAVMKR